eukprot:112389-Chlamydomonas_euryale.AAC.1
MFLPGVGKGLPWGSKGALLLTRQLQPGKAGWLAAGPQQAAADSSDHRMRHTSSQKGYGILGREAG